MLMLLIESWQEVVRAIGLSQTEIMLFRFQDSAFIILWLNELDVPLFGSLFCLS